MCFGLGSLETLLIWIIIVCAIIALLQLLVRFLVPHLGLTGEVVSFITAAVRIIVWAIVCIAAVYLIFDVIFCLALSLPRLR